MSAMFCLFALLLAALAWIVWRIIRPDSAPKRYRDSAPAYEGVTLTLTTARIRGWLTLECAAYDVEIKDIPEKLTDIGHPINMEIMYDPDTEQPHMAVINSYFYKGRVIEHDGKKYTVWDAYWHDYPLVEIL